MNHPVGSNDAQYAQYDKKDAEWWIILSTPSHNAHKNNTEDHGKKRHWPKKLWAKVCEVTLSDWLMVLFTAVIAYYASAQYAEMHGAGAQTDRIIAADERLATAMENSVAASGKALDATIAQNQLDQRAWVGPVGIIQPDFKGTSAFSISTLISNSGKTPALNFRNKYTWVIMLKKGIFKATYKNPQGVPSTSAIFPNDRLTLISIPIPLRSEFLDLITRGEALFYVYGELTYDDVFRQPHFTHFCMFYDSTFKPGVCQTYNDAN
jgi:hypothetical protein